MKLFKWFTAFIFLVIACYPAISQDTSVPVERSDKIVIRDGTKCYVHKVEEKQTLYSLGKAYGVDIETIKEFNPKVRKKGLQARSKIYIPYIVKINTEKDTSKYIYHTVKKKETLYAISKKYGYKADELKKFNPGLTEDIKIGQEIKIPRKKSAIPEKTKEKIRIITHVVQRKETLYSIYKKYGVDIEEIKKYNPVLYKEELKSGTELKIPVHIDLRAIYPPDTAKIADFPPDSTLTSDSLSITADTLTLEDSLLLLCDTFRYENYDKPFNVALMLPFYLKSNDTLEVTHNIENLKAAIHPRSVRFLEYYQGSLFAIKELKKAGLSVHLYVYDTRNSEKRINKILEGNEFKKMNLIIGPMYSDNMKIVATFALEKKIPVVSPLSSHDEFLEDNPYVIQINTNYKILLQQMKGFFSRNKQNNFVMVKARTGEEGNEEKILTPVYRRLLLSAFYDNQRDSIVNLIGDSLLKNELIKARNGLYKEFRYQQNLYRDLNHAMVDTCNNFVIIPSSDLVLVTKIINLLSNVAPRHKIMLFGNWKNVRKIDLTSKFHMNLHYYHTFYINEKDSIIVQFDKSYYQIFKSLPSKYSYQGYNVMLYFLNVLKSYGPEFIHCLPEARFETLQHSFVFRRKTEGAGYINTTVFLVHYDKETYELLLTGVYTDDEVLNFEIKNEK